MRKNVGYFEGTDPSLLTDLVCNSYDTVPISNGFDNHGMHVRIINNENHIDVLIGFVHKIYASDDDVQSGGVVTYQDVFHVCRTFDIPLVLAVHRELHDKARKLFKDIPDVVEFVDPEDMLSRVKGILNGD